MKIRPAYQIILLILVVLAVYYPVLFAGINSVDDANMITWLQNRDGLRLFELFRPGSSFYYRPLMLLSLYGDKYFWDFSPSFMHLENMLLHAANAVLIYFIARRVFLRVIGPVQLLPLVCAILFALHPINTESVNWISGRTDLLATFFILISCRILIWMAESERPVLGLLAAVFFLAGVMSKEVSLFFLPAGCFLLWRWPVDKVKVTALSRVKGMLFFSGPFVLGAIAYVVSRFVRFGFSDSGVNYILDGYSYDIINTLRVACKALGFYVKKLFLPLPLNFAIIGADDHYVWLGILVLFLMFVLVWRRKLLTDLLVISIFLISPAIIIALTNVAWTPLAERYLYLPSVFWSIAVVGMSYLFIRELQLRAVLPVVALVLLVAAGWLTFERNLIWQNPLDFYEDAIIKTPGFPPLHNELASALLKAGRVAEAEEQLLLVRRLDPDQRIPVLHLGQIQLLVSNQQLDEAMVLLNELLAEPKKRKLSFLRQVARIQEAMLALSRNEAERQANLEALLLSYQKVMEKTGKPYIRYRAGQIALFLDRDDLAAAYFSEAYQSAPESAYYRQAAGILAEKLSTDETHTLH